MTEEGAGPPQGSDGPTEGPPGGSQRHAEAAVDHPPVTCRVCSRPMVRSKAPGVEGGPLWVCNGGPGERHPWEYRERIVREGEELDEQHWRELSGVELAGPRPMVNVLVRDALAAILEGGGNALRVEAEAQLKALIAEPALATMGVKVPTPSPTGVQMDTAERERAGRRILAIMQDRLGHRLPDFPIGPALVICQEMVGAVVDFPGVDPLRSPGLESLPTDRRPAIAGIYVTRTDGDTMPTSIWLCPDHWEEFHVPHGGKCPSCPKDLVRYDVEWVKPPRPTVQSPVDGGVLDRAQVNVELGDLKTVARDKGWDLAFEWITAHQAAEELPEVASPSLAELPYCERCTDLAERRGVPYRQVYEINHPGGPHSGPDDETPDFEVRL